MDSFEIMMILILCVVIFADDLETFISENPELHHAKVMDPSYPDYEGHVFWDLQRKAFSAIATKNKDIIGTFEIKEQNQTPSLSISVEDEFQGLGLSRFLVRILCDSKKVPYSPRYLFFIDGDGSNGFWEKMGMKENRYGYGYKGNRDLLGKGYEKSITFEDMCAFGAKRGKKRKF